MATIDCNRSPVALMESGYPFHEVLRELRRVVKSMSKLSPMQKNDKEI
jgi:hypothetical protein